MLGHYHVYLADANPISLGRVHVPLNSQTVWLCNPQRTLRYSEVSPWVIPQTSLMIGRWAPVKYRIAMTLRNSMYRPYNVSAWVNMSDITPACQAELASELVPRVTSMNLFRTCSFKRASPLRLATPKITLYGSTHTQIRTRPPSLMQRVLYTRPRKWNLVYHESSNRSSEVLG